MGGLIRKIRLNSIGLNSHRRETSHAQDRFVCRCRRCDRDWLRSMGSLDHQWACGLLDKSSDWAISIHDERKGTAHPGVCRPYLRVPMSRPVATEGLRPEQGSEVVAPPVAANDVRGERN